jgi:hypothetical protein
MRAGFGKALVNPPLGMAMEGLGQQGGCQAINDDLFVRALYLVQGTHECLIIGYDLLFFERAVIDRYKNAIGRALELKPCQILLNTSHTHAGPRLTHWAYSDGPDANYLDVIEAASLAAARSARAAARGVTLYAGTATTRMPVSRRKILPDGTCQWAPFLKAPICDTVPFCLFKDSREQVVSVLFAASCHPSTYYELNISADYPGAAMRKLNAHFKTDGALFLQGAGGDTKPRQIAVAEDHWKHGRIEDIEAAGAEVADAVIARARSVLGEVVPDLRTHLQELAWPLQPAPAREVFEAIQKNPEEREARRKWAADMLAKQACGGLPTAVPVTLHAVQLGIGLSLLGVEGEVVGELGNLMLREFEHGVTFVLGYTNGCQIYLPITPMLQQGGYEVDSYWEYHFPSPPAPGGEQVLIDAIRELRRKHDLT